MMISKSITNTVNFSYKIQIIKITALNHTNFQHFKKIIVSQHFNNIKCSFQLKSSGKLHISIMKSYESMMIQRNNRFQYMKNDKSLEPIMEYDYYFQGLSQHEGRAKQSILNNESDRVKNKGNREEKGNHQKVGNENKIKTKQLEMPQKQISKYNVVNNTKASKVPTKTHQNELSSKPAAQQPLKQPKVLTQHNPIAYSSTLFPQPQSVKQKLKQNLQQQMLSNYYISKYSTIMNKITNENIKIQLPIDMTERSFSNNKDNQPLMGNKKKRRNFKEVMRQKGAPLQKGVKIQQNNQFVGKRLNSKDFQAETFIKTPLQREQRDDSLNITFSPVKINLIAKNDKKQQRLPQSNRSHHSHTSSISHSNRDKSSANYSSQKQRQNHDSLRESPSHSHSPHSKNFQHRQSTPESRLNFKQSLKEKKSLYLQYEQNYDLYKKLQSSIIDQLYSPSPKKIQRDKFNEICFIDRQLTVQQRKMLRLKEKSGIRDYYDDSLVRNIQVNEEGYQAGGDVKGGDLDLEEIDNNAQRAREVDLLRQSIRRSIQSIHSRSEMSSPSPNAKYRQLSRMNESPSRGSPGQSPQRSLVPNKHKTKSSQGSKSDVERQQMWNSNFYSLNSHNKKYLNNEQLLGNKRASSPRNTPDGGQRKYHSLEKQSAPQTQKSLLLKSFQSKAKSKKFSEQKFPINQQENEFDSDPQNAPYNTTDHNESYNNVSKRLGNEVSIAVDSQKHLSTKSHQRKGSFHSVRSDRNLKNYQPIDSRFIVANFNASRNSNQTVNEPSQQQEDDDDYVEFVPAANENMFSEKGSQGSKSKYSSPTRKNLIETVGHTRSRKASDHFSFISDDHNNASRHEMSMLSRFSMTSQEGSTIIQKLENEITQNEFGPYQHALQSIRQLLYEHKTAWPIYVVGQRILDDRSQYEKKIELQGRMMDDYKEKIMQMKRKQQEYQNETDMVKRNKLQILKLVRQLCSNN